MLAGGGTFMYSIHIIVVNRWIVIAFGGLVGINDTILAGGGTFAGWWWNILCTVSTLS